MVGLLGAGPAGHRRAARRAQPRRRLRHRLPRRGRPGQPPTTSPPGCARSSRRECAALGLPVPRLAVEPGRAIAGPGHGHALRDRHDQAGAARRQRRPGHAAGAQLRLGRRRDERQHPHRALRRRATPACWPTATSDAPPALCRVVGKHCESGDILVRDLWLPADVQPGDLLAVAATGAYCWSMASNYNYLLKPPVVAVRDGVGHRDRPAADTVGRVRPRRRPRRRARALAGAVPAGARARRVGARS